VVGPGCGGWASGVRDGFGLSMDYELFVVSQIKEHADAGKGYFKARDRIPPATQLQAPQISAVRS